MNTCFRWTGGAAWRRGGTVAVTAVAVLVCWALILTQSCQSRSHRTGRAEAPRERFDYYILSLSWAPAFCAGENRAETSRECDPQRHTGFIVHGLWPELEDGRPLEFCRAVPPARAAIVDDLLPIMPDRMLIQHEWRAHGSCTGLPASEYFAAVRRAADRVRIPELFLSTRLGFTISPREIEHRFGEASHFGDVRAIYVQCRRGELTEVRVCLTKNLEPRPCGDRVRDCASRTLFVRRIQ